jgi:hypothetical protein
LEKEGLQSLGLRNLFPTTWPKLGLHPSRPSKWKKSYSGLYSKFTRKLKLFKKEKERKRKKT